MPGGKKVHLLPATLETTQWGWFDNAQAPVLRVNSGDTIALETMMHSHNQVVPGATIEQIKKLRTDFPGRGPHTLTGPIYIEGAQPGDVLKVTLNKIVPRAYATNFNVPGLFGQFPTVYQDGQVKYLYLDLEKMQTEFLPGIVLPLKPFPGTLAVARKEPGRYSSVPPGEFAGNMDIRDFVAGTSLYVPVHVPGALLWTGDSHAGQGNGEVNLTAIETAYKELNLTVEVIKGKPLDFPRIETAKSWITMGFDPDLNKAWAQTKAQTIKLLSEQRKVSADQAEKLMASVSDCRVSQVVNIKKGIHCLNPKNAGDKEDMERPTKETSKYYVSHVRDADLNKAMNDASMGMIKWLELEKKIARTRRLRAGQRSDGWSAVKAVFSSGVLLTIAAIYFVTQLAIWGIVFFLPSIVESFGVTHSAAIGAIAGIPAIGALIGVLAYPRLFRTYGHPILFIAVALASAGLAGYFGAHSGPVGTLAAFAVLQLFAVGVGPVLWSTAMDTMHGRKSAAGLAMINSIGLLGGFFGPSIFGLVETSSGTATGAGVFLSYLFIAALVLTAVLYVLLRNAKPQRSDLAQPAPEYTPAVPDL